MSFSPLDLAHMYECLRNLPPFAGWKLPHSDEIEFRALRRKDDHGEYTEPNVIMVSTERNGHLDTILQTLAHEMIHLVLGVNKAHGLEFQKRARRVCKAFGWDYKAF